MPPSKKGKKPQKQSSQQPPSTAESSKGADSKGKQPVRLPPTEESAQLGSRVEKPEVATARPDKRKEQSSGKGKEREEPERSVQHISKGKLPLRGPPDQSVKEDSKAPPQPFPPDSGRTSPETARARQQPYVQSESEDVESDVEEAKQRQDPPAKEMGRSEAKSKDKGKQPMPKPSEVKSKDKGKQPVSKPSETKSKDKGKQPVSKPVYGNPRCYIARIPVKNDAPIERRLVSIGPDTAYRHPQTFFFKNIPCLEPFWGYSNFKAFTATRIIRMERDEVPTSYFLMVCRGEWPRVKSPRNDNALFTNFYGPIFGDAFVFKLGEPELYGDGYARYVHIEKDIGRFDWLPNAIRLAAMKVENALAPDADPGFPDISNYASREIMNKDATRMLKYMAAIKNANFRYTNTVPLDAESGLPDFEGMLEIASKWASQVLAWKSDGTLKGAHILSIPEVEIFTDRVLDFHKAVQDGTADPSVDEKGSASAKVGWSYAELTNQVKKVYECFMAARNAFFEVKALTKRKNAKKVQKALRAELVDGKPNMVKLKKLVDAMMTNFEIWKEEYADADEAVELKLLDEMAAKAQAAYRAIEEERPISEMIQTVQEMNYTYGKLELAVREQEAAETAEMNTSDTQEADEASTSGANPETSNARNLKVYHITDLEALD